MDFEKLEKEFFKVKDDSLSFIRYFESNSDFIAKLDDNDEEQRGFKLKMNGDYGLSLAASGSPKKAVEVLEGFIPKFEKESGLDEDELSKTAYYEHLLWAFGSSLYYTDKIDETEKVFSRLVELQPENQKYKNWLRATKQKRYSRLRTILYVLLFAWIFVEIVFIKSMTSGLKMIFMMTGLGVICGTIILEAYLFFLKRKYQ